MLKWPEPRKSGESLETYYQRIHTWALSIFTYQMDSVIWHEPDHWETRLELEKLYEEYGRVVGDCDSFVQLFRHAISPIPSRIVLGWVETDEYHAQAETPEGFVSEVRSPGIMVWADLIGRGYKKHIMGPLCDPQIPNPGEFWTKAI